MAEQLYEIIRMYEDNRRARVMRRGLTLKQEQEHCKDPETSSMTKGNPTQKTIDKWHEQQKHWFDAYRSM